MFFSFLLQMTESSNLSQNTEDLKKRLEMAELYAQQMSNQSENNVESLQVVEELQREKEQLTKQALHVGVLVIYSCFGDYIMLPLLA